MTEHNRLDAAAPWVEVVATDQDWDTADPDLLTNMFSQLVLVRTFEEFVLELAAEGLIHGPAHSSIGQEGGAVGSVLALTAEDTVNGSHRGHHQFLAKVLSYLAPKGFNPTEDVDDDVRAVLLRTLAEICGLDRGFSHGRGGSMHLQWKEAGAIGTNAIVGGGVPLAAGSAWAHQFAGTDAVAVTYFGDGASNIGSTLETFNLAAAWKLPICFFIENNQYAVSTNVTEATAEPRLSARGPGFGIASWKVDGMNPLAVYLAMQEAVAHMRAGNGPTIVEADVYRYFHQNGPFPGSAFGYRTKAEEKAWKQRDPILQVAAHLLRRNILTQDEINGTTERAKQLMADIGREILEPLPGGKPGQRRIKPAEWPDPNWVDFGVRGDLSEFDNARTADRDGFTGEIAEQKFIETIAKVLRSTDGNRPHHRGDGGGRAPAQRRHQRCHQRPQRCIPGPRPRNTHQRERLRRPGWWHRPGRPIQTSRRIHVRRLHVGRRRPAVQPDRQGTPHVRRRGRRALRAAKQGRDGHRLRIATLHGPRRGIRHSRRLADRRAIDTVRLRRTDEQRPADARTRSWSSNTSTCTPPWATARWTTWTTASRWARQPSERPAASSPSSPTLR